MRKRPELTIVGGVEGKECTSCEKWMPLSEYYNQKRGLGGRASRCINCKREYRKLNNDRTAEKRKEYYLNNKEKYRAQSQKRYAANREKILFDLKNMSHEERERAKASKRAEYRRNRDKYLERAKKYAEANRETIAQYNADYYRKNKPKIKRKSAQYRLKNADKLSEAKKEWRLANLEKEKIAKLKRRALKLSLPNDFTEEDSEECLKFFGGCALTGRIENIHWDHVIPIAIGHGGTTKGNMIPLRGDLNVSKHTRNIFEWFESSKERFDLPQENFDRLVQRLADINGMSTDEYRDYVYWCHENPREIDDTKSEKEGANG